MCNQAEALSILRETAERCKTAYDGKIRDVYLYGSFARGDFHEESDVDILLTADLSASAIATYRPALARICSDLSLQHGVTVSATVKPYAQFKKFSSAMPYYRNVMQEGIRYDG